jgi:hypothetical protein
MRSARTRTHGTVVSVSGVGTGERGDRVRLDDTHNVIKIDSVEQMEKTVRFFRKSMSNRLNDEDSAIIVCMQPLRDNDVSGDILAREADYCHLMIPMRFEPMLYPASADGLRTEDPKSGEAFTGNDLGWIDPRALDEEGELLSPREMAQYEGELAWPERFPPAMDRGFEYELGDNAYAGQYQQSPVPRKGGIIKCEYRQRNGGSRRSQGDDRAWPGDHPEDLRGLALSDRKKRLVRLVGRRTLGIVLSAHRPMTAPRSTGRHARRAWKGSCRSGSARRTGRGRRGTG